MEPVACAHGPAIAAPAVSAGIVGLLDDVAAMAKLAAASVDDVGAAAGRASAKAAGVVVDDTAVTPRYVHGFTADRELPMIKRIAVGSLRNKLLIILPVILVLSEFLPWLLAPILMIGGIYLCFEGAEKIYEKVTGHHDTHADQPAAIQGADRENVMVKSAIRTDFILSAEIMVISLNEVADEGLISRAAILVVVAIGITLLVYGVVGLIVKMDDVGLHLSERNSGTARRVGLLAGPWHAQAVGAAVHGGGGGDAVGGRAHPVGGRRRTGLARPLRPGPRSRAAVAGAVPVLGGVLAWLINTLASALIGLVVGALVVAIMHLVPRRTRAAKH